MRGRPMPACPGVRWVAWRTARSPPPRENAEKGSVPRTLGGMAPRPGQFPVARDGSGARRRPSATGVPRAAAAHPVVAQRMVGRVPLGADDRRHRPRGLVGQPDRLRGRVPPDGPGPGAVRVTDARGRPPAAVLEPAGQRFRRPVAARVPVVHLDRRLPPRAHGAPPPGVRPRRARHPALRRLPDQPDASFRRKLVRDADRPHRVQVVPRPVRRASARPTPKVRRTLLEILLVQAVLLGAAIAGGYWWVYPVLWVLPFLTVWRVINRLRADRRARRHGRVDPTGAPTTHSVRQHVVARASSCRTTSAGTSRTTSTPGVSMRNLPRYHRALLDAGYVTPSSSTRATRGSWRALRAR